MFGRKKQYDRTKTEFLNELAAQRECAQSLVDRYEAEVKTARGAVRAVGKAREERDEYRRVLAAAIATERRREAEVARLEGEHQRLEALAHQEMRSASEESARRQELKLRLDRLEIRLTEELGARERALGDAADRAWAEREASREEFVRLVAAHRDEVTTSLKRTTAELEKIKRTATAAAAKGPAVVTDRSVEHTVERIIQHPVAMVMGLRARLLVGLSVASTLIAVALIPLAVLSISDPERALFVHLASGVGPWHLIGLVVVFSAVAVALLSWAIRDLKSPASGSTSPLDQESKGELVPQPKPDVPPRSDETAKAPDPQPNPNAGRNGTLRT